MADALFRPGVAYYKIGGGMLDLISDRQRQPDLFAAPENPALMLALDKLNDKYGRDAIFLADQAITACNVAL
ncbi:MAG: DUF4113 domain-containing protein [Photobacterium frigidiphilum]|uniref:DUF4113 domain-containing protein n=1 Tax=Photobacterium frigidiphilum TaxID=264736 RepID=UPI00300113D1